MKEYSFGIIPLKRRKGEWQVLLVQHTQGHWGFPKGHAEAGETPWMSAERELFEETGLTVSRLLSETKFTDSYIFSSEGKKIHKTVLYFIAEVTGTPQPQLEEVQALQWVPLKSVAEQISFPNAKKICVDLEKLLNQQG